MKITLTADFTAYNKFIEAKNLDLLPFGLNIPDTREIIDSFNCAFFEDDWDLDYVVTNQLLTLTGFKNIDQANEVKEFILSDYKGYKLPVNVEITQA